MFLIAKNSKIDISLVVLIGLIGFLSNIMFIKADGDIDTETSNKIKQSINNVMKHKYGEVKIKGKAPLDSELVIAEDDKYDYKIDPSNKSIATMQIKDYNKFAYVEGNLSEQELNKLSKQIIEMFYPDRKDKFVLQSKTYKDNGTGKYYQIIFNEIEKNGVGTGETIAFDINKQGELLGVATHKGNPSVALNKKAKLTSNQAIDIATAYIINKYPKLEGKKLPKAEFELTVFKDKLIWRVRINKIDLDKSTFGYVFYIDAETGEIIFNDHYFAIG